MRIIWKNKSQIWLSLMRTLKNRQILLTFGSLLCLLGYILFVHDCSDSKSSSELRPETAKVIFVDGFPSSGTTLMRVLLDAHPAIRCGAEPMITQEVIHARNSMTEHKRKRAIEAGIFPEAYDEAVAAFVVKVLQYMGPPAEWLCHKQPLTLLHMEYLSKIFPQAMFVHILRDGRAAVASSIERHLYKMNATKILENWERAVTTLLKACQNIGSMRCMTVRYERLILEPETEMRHIFEFLGIPWDPIVLHHHTMLGNLTHLNRANNSSSILADGGGLSGTLPVPSSAISSFFAITDWLGFGAFNLFSRIYEPSTKQIKRAIHKESLAKWTGPGSILPRDFIQTAGIENALLAKLGYSACGIPPNYDGLPSSVPHID